MPRKSEQSGFRPFLFPLLIPVVLCAVWVVLSRILDIQFAGSSWYNTYTLQAMTWRSGQLALPQDYPYLELAIFKGQYYVSFPPLPSVLLLPLTFLFGSATPDNLMVKLYTAAACEAMYFALLPKKRSALPGEECGAGSRWAAFALSLLIGLSSSLLPMTLEGAVWYQAQVLAWALMMVAVSLLVQDRPTPALLCCALSVACRPFDALYLLPMYLFAFDCSRKRREPLAKLIRRLLPGTLAGLCVAAAIALFNYARFGDVLEFGHNYLPEFSTQGGIQFSLGHVLNNMRTFVWGLPLEMNGGVMKFRRFGYSAFIACPALTLMLLLFIRDVIRREATLPKVFIVLTMLVHFFFLLWHRTFGGFQLGARYTADLLPYAFFYLAVSGPKKARNAVWTAVMLLGFAFTFWGVTQVHI